ncbi:MAG: VanZ family protein [Bacteroidetes bacterium]|nr:VanZ family protein [Bacteroidota bacterium]
MVIFGLCATPGQYIPSLSWLELLSFDKLVHASIFFILVVLILIVCIKYTLSLRRVIFYVALCIFYGGLLEWMQANLFSNRSGDALDFIANTFGCLAGCFFYKKLKRIYFLFS